MALAELTVRHQGKPVLCDRVVVEQAVADTLAHCRLDGLPRVTVREQVTEQPVRAFRDRPATLRTLASSRSAAKWKREPWRARLSSWDGGRGLPRRVSGGAQLRTSDRTTVVALPTYIERDDHVTDLVRLLSLALRVLTRLQFVVRRQLTPADYLDCGDGTASDTTPIAPHQLQIRGPNGEYLDFNPSIGLWPILTLLLASCTV